MAGGWGEWDVARDGGVDITGTYRDEWQADAVFYFEQSGNVVKVSTPDGDGSWGSDTGKLEGSQVTLADWRLAGTFDGKAITWSNGSVWVREPPAVKEGAAIATPEPETGATESEDPWAEVAAAASVINVSGTYSDPWQGSQWTIEQDGTKVTADGEKNDWGLQEGTILGDDLSIFGLTAKFKDGCLHWPNGNVWKPVQAASVTPSPAALGEPRTTEDGDTPDVSGTYTDPWQNNQRCVITQRGAELTAEFPDEPSWGRTLGTINGSEIELFGQQAHFRNGSIVWANTNEWSRAAGTSAPEGAAAAGSMAWSDSGGTGAAAAAATDAWTAGAASGAAGASWGTEAAAPAANSMLPVNESQKRARWREFDMWQEWYRDNAVTPGKNVEEIAADEARLFAQSGDDRAGVDFDLYDKVSCDISGPKAEKIPELTTFEALYSEFDAFLPPQLVDNIRRSGWRRPTPVQKFSIPAALTGRDIMCCAQTGSGKTAAFLVPVLASMIKHSKATGALEKPYEGPCKPDTVVISPTRELCLQTYDEALKFCHKTDHRCVRVYGQEPPKVQIPELAKGADLCIATPGRLWDFVTSGIIEVTDVNCLVLDEADRMLMMNMEGYIREVVEKWKMPPREERQTLMFSATFPPECQKLAGDYLYQHIWIGVGSIGAATPCIKQQLVKVTPEGKFDELCRVLEHFLDNREPHERLLVFCNKKIEAKGLDERLYERNIDTGALHGDLTQPERETNLARLRSGEIDVLVATDLASRGLDIINVSHVVNYDLPWQVDGYVQRIGRTGRIGHRGQATTFVAVDPAGKFLDDEAVLKALPSVMKDDAAGCHNEVPDWLLDYVDAKRQQAWVDDQDDKKWWLPGEQTDARSAYQDKRW